jgi:hypothetical protein
MEKRYIEAKIEDKIELVLKVLNKRFGNIPESISLALNSCQDPIALDSLFEWALDCETSEEFEWKLEHL